MTPEERAGAFMFRALQDAWLDATARYWRRRERDFWWVITGDRTVEPTPAQLDANPAMAEVIAACRNRATREDASLRDLAGTIADHEGMTL